MEASNAKHSHVSSTEGLKERAEKPRITPIPIINFITTV